MIAIKGFMLDNHGDVVIESNKISMVDGKELLRQTIWGVLSTNKGEWPLDLDEGITFQNILGKNRTEEMIKYEVQQGLFQVDNTFTLLSFALEKVNDRQYKVSATAQNADGAEITVDTIYG